jgi:hypothetical protein
MKFHKDWFRGSKVDGGDTQTHTHTDSNVIYKESRLKMKITSTVDIDVGSFPFVTLRTCHPLPRSHSTLRNFSS